VPLFLPMNSTIHNWNGSAITQLSTFAKIGKFDIPAGYVSATEMCKACGKQFNDYARLDSTKTYWGALSIETGIPVSNLVISIKGRGDKIEQGTWIHPEIAIDLAQWVSVDFRIWANRTLRQVMTNQQPPTPTHLTNAQLILAMATQLAEQEQKQMEIETRLKMVEAEQDRFLTPSGHKFTILGYASLQKLQISAKEAAALGRKATQACKSQNLAVEQVTDPRFGKVGLYPESVLIQVFSQLDCTPQSHQLKP